MIKSACHDNQAEKYDNKIYCKTSKIGKDYIRENYFELHDRLINLLDIDPTDTLLDIGIGTGLLEEKIKGKCTICGIDISEKMLAKARDKGLGIELKKGSFLDIPYEDGRFNSIVSCFAFHHLSDGEKDRAWNEMTRVLKANGKIIIGDFMYWDGAAREGLERKFLVEGREDMVGEMDEENFTDIGKLKDKTHQRGFSFFAEQVSTISWIVKIEK